MLPVAMRPGETPVPIPNTMVKARAADGTMLETAWESRWLPDSFKNYIGKCRYAESSIRHPATASLIHPYGLQLMSAGTQRNNPYVCALTLLTGAYSSAG